MNIGNWLIACGAAASLAGVYFMLRMVGYLRSRGEKVSFLLFRLRWFQYMERYRELTLGETGEPGSWLLWYKVAMLAALLLVISGALALNG